MKVALIWAAALGFSAAVAAGSLGFSSPIVETSTSYQEPLQSFGMEAIPAELDYSMYLGTADFLANEPSVRSHSWQLPSDPPRSLIILGGLAFFVAAGALRAIPLLRQRMTARREERQHHHGHRRKVKIEMRMMA